MQKLPFLLFLLPHSQSLFGCALRIALRIPEFSDSFSVFGLAAHQEIKEQVSLEKISYLLQCFNSLKIKVVREPLGKSI